MQQSLIWQTQIFDLTDDLDRQAFDALQTQGKIWRIHDSIDEQLKDLVRTRNPQWIKYPVVDAHLQAEITQLLDNVSIKEYGRWIYYPWSGEMVHLLPAAQFRELRLNRNRNKITEAEQTQLEQVTLGIVGLSVGNAVVTALAIEGIGGRLKLADFDRLDLSNMNRIRSAVSDIALPKTVLCARQIMEINPYAQLELFSDGLTETNLEAFFDGESPLDIVIDECDDIRIKFLLRETARARGIPVLMETSDRGMLDVERFDLEPHRPLFHGLLGDTTSANVPAKLTNEEKVPFVAPIIGIESLSARFGASMIEIGESITTWPQLGSEILLGGATVSAAVRTLVLTGELSSGRRYIELAELIHQKVPLTQFAKSAVSSLKENSSGADSRVQQISEFMHFMVSQAILAPSGGNTQPWYFYTDNETLWVIHDKLRSQNLLDPAHRGAYVALGAAIENMQIAAAQCGYATQIAYLPCGQPANIYRDRIDNKACTEVVAALQFIPDPTAQLTTRAGLSPYLQRRMTDRHTYGRIALQSSQRDELHNTAQSSNCHLHLLETDSELQEIGAIISEGDRLRFLHRETNRELMSEMRWTAEEAKATGDGIDVATMALSATQKAGIQLMRRPEIVQLLRSQNGGLSLKELSDKAIRHSSAVGLISIQGHLTHQIVQGGQALEALWLTATKLGLTWHPMTSLLYMLQPEFKVEFTPHETSVLHELRQRLAHLFSIPANETPLLLFRLSQGQQQGLRSLRRPLNQVLAFGKPPTVESH